MNGQLYVEDCQTTLNRLGLAYAYVFCSPPDLADLRIPPEEPKLWAEFIASVFTKLSPTLGLVSVSTTDRKGGGRIIRKHSIVADFFEVAGARLIYHKIWQRSANGDMRHLQFAHVQTFALSGAKPPLYGDLPVIFRPDVWSIPIPQIPGIAFMLPQPTELAERHILAFTKPGQTVFDPFMGTGGTAAAAEKTGRLWIGAEINPENAKHIETRIKLETKRLL